MKPHFDPSDPNQRKYNGYGPSRLPDARDDEVALFVAEVIEGGVGAVSQALDRITEPGRDVLRAYAERMASLAVRRKDRGRLVSGLVALVLGGLGENRVESLMIMALIEDGAKRIGENLQGIFDEVSAIVGHPATANLMLWASRNASDRSLSSMGFKPGSDEDGFRYQLDW